MTRPRFGHAAGRAFHHQPFTMAGHRDDPHGCAVLPHPRKGGRRDNTGRSRGRLLRPGDVIRISEADHLGGTGELVMRITAVDPHLGRYPTLEWARLTGVPLDGNGGAGPAREVMVRVAAILHVGSRDQPWLAT